jgi:hypothetical protein
MIEFADSATDRVPRAGYLDWARGIDGADRERDGECPMEEWSQAEISRAMIPPKTRQVKPMVVQVAQCMRLPGGRRSGGADKSPFTR